MHQLVGKIVGMYDGRAVVASGPPDLMHRNITMVNIPEGFMPSFRFDEDVTIEVKIAPGRAGALNHELVRVVEHARPRPSMVA